MRNRFITLKQGLENGPWFQADNLTALGLGHTRGVVAVMAIRSIGDAGTEISGFLILDLFHAV